MREIKFRGRTPSGKWVYGYYVGKDTIIPFENVNFDLGFIDTSPCYEVIPDTIGQFTGLLDKNGKEIYEGDIVSFTADKESKNWVRPIKWLGAGFTFGDIFPLNYPSSCYEVIGNIHDNRELLNE